MESIIYTANNPRYLLILSSTLFNFATAILQSKNFSTKNSLPLLQNPVINR